jgi:arylsulfatase A-like enzyme
MRPNVVLVLVDDMGYGDFGVFNEGACRTPVLDGLVADGVCLTQHYSGSCVCAPSRGALLTGRYPHRTGAIDTLEGRGLDRLGLNEVTMADLFKSAGYATGLVGKWHLGALDPRYHPNARGFDEFAGFRGGWQDYYDWRLDRNGSFEKADGRYLTDVLTEEAVEFIGRHRDEPFFLHLTYNAPHFPLQAPDEDVNPFRESGRYTEGVCQIYGMINRVDQGLQKILQKLDDHKLTENTIVMFTSDNGPQLGGQGEMSTARHNCGFNGAKGNVYEGGIRVPMVIRWPGSLRPGKSLDEVVHFTDWLPTLAEAAGLEIPDHIKLDGESILPLLKGEGEGPGIPRFWQWNRYTPVGESNAAMRDGPWKLVRPRIKETMVVAEEDLEMDRALKYDPDRFVDIVREDEPERTIPDSASPELYNLESDPLEKEDLAKEEPAILSNMLSRLESWFEDVEFERREVAE